MSRRVFELARKARENRRKSVFIYMAVRQCLLECLQAFVRDFGLIEDHFLELIQPLKVFQPSVRDSGSEKVYLLELP